MTRQYWVGDFFVDLSRNQISQSGQPQTLPPKVMQVLTLLAKHAGKVVTYEQILEEVWSDAVVTPNTLQRSIAELRKALGDDSKSQSIVKTHSKQGYSLESDVNWVEPVLPSVVKSESSTHIEPQTKEHEVGNTILALRGKMPVSKAYWLVAFAALVALVFLTTVQRSDQKIEFGDLRYLTATDDKEFAASYSPDGRFILFRRYLNRQCVNNIWAKDAQKLQEVQLTVKAGNYSGQRLSPDNKNLVFIEAQDCIKPVTQNTCYSLKRLDFEAAISQPQGSETLLECLTSSIQQPRWTDNRHIALLQTEDKRKRLILFSIDTYTSTTLYEVEGAGITGFDYSRSRHVFAVTSRKADNAQYVELLSVDGTLISSHRIKIPDDFPGHLDISAQFVPNTEQLIFDYAGKIFSLATNGDIDEIALPFDSRVGMPSVHPQGESLLLIRGQFDADVATLTLPAGVENDPLSYTVFERSTGLDDFALFHPENNDIAMVSNRTGTGQVWRITHGDMGIVSDFPKGSYIQSLHWDYEGEHFLVLVVNELYALSEDAQLRHIKSDYLIKQVFHWNSDDNTLLANVQVEGDLRFVSVDLGSLSYNVISNKGVIWADMNRHGDIVFLDAMERFWKKGAVEDELLANLTGQGWDRKRFVMDEHQIIGINREHRLWSYQLESGAFRFLANVPPDIGYLTDVKNNQLLARVIVADKKEIIELSIKH